MIKFNQAQRIVLKSILALNETEVIPILEGLGRVLSEDIYARDNIPQSSNSAMDGYAVKCADTKNSGVVLKIIENIKAGDSPLKALNRGEASRIMTGAVIPEGADCVIEVEQTKLKNRGYVSVLKKVEKFRNIRFRGEDVKKGSLVIRKGLPLSPQEIGMLAALGRSGIKVIRRPKVAIIATGDELIEPKDKLTKGKVRNSNNYSLFALCLRYGAIPVNLGIARDNLKAVKNKIMRALGYDMVLTSAGISVGDYDMVKTVLGSLGRGMKFWKVAMRPGKPLAFGIIRNKPVFGLPGNPVSSIITFLEFVGPALLKMQGIHANTQSDISAVLKEDIKKKKGYRFFLRGRLKVIKGKYSVTPYPKQGSGILRSLVESNCLIVLSEEHSLVKKGAVVTVQPLI